MSFLGFPYLGFPYYNKRPYQRYGYKYNNMNSVSSKEPSKEDDVPPSQKNFNDNNSQEFFEILGIKLYFDDVLIICLLFFLYSEDVQDQSLFICLILLLLT